jgi:hypothetical protein
VQAAVGAAGAGKSKAGKVGGKKKAGVGPEVE